MMDDSQIWLSMSPEQRIVYKAAEAMAKALDLDDGQTNCALGAFCEWGLIRVASKAMRKMNRASRIKTKHAILEMQENWNNNIEQLQESHPDTIAMIMYCMINTGLAPDVVHRKTDRQVQDIDIIPKHLRKQSKT